jgi:hypothetical protein
MSTCLVKTGNHPLLSVSFGRFPAPGTALQFGLNGRLPGFQHFGNPIIDSLHLADDA